ncbi:hypothetical protein BJX70DRAFT_404915 [Aspergillus crustosus]
MASAAPVAALVSDPASKPFNEPSQPNVDAALEQQGGDSPALTRPNDASPEESNAKQDSTPTNDTVNGEVTKEQPAIGEKRDHEVTPATKSSAGESVEPDSKKQKTSEENKSAANGTSTTATAQPTQPPTEKKKGGRPRKTKDTVKKKATTDGIGSRTRSRTKVVS